MGYLQVLQCRACWDKFNDTVSQVVGYSAQARELHNETYEVGDPVDVGLAQRVHLMDLHLKVKLCQVIKQAKIAFI